MSDAGRTAEARATAEFNQAFLGYAIGTQGVFIRVCGACPGAPAVEAFARKPTAVKLSHGLCPMHYQEQLEEIISR